MADPPVKMGGFKLSFAAAKNKTAPKKATNNLAKRPKLDLGEEEPEDTNTKQEISGFDLAQGGAVELNAKKKEEKGPLVIPAPPNKNWRDEARRRHAARTGHGQQVDQEKEEAKIQYGLTIKQKDAVVETNGDAPMEDAPPVTIDDGLTVEQRLEKRAVDALLNDNTPVDITTIAMSEDQVFAKELADAPDAPTLSAYEATPIDGFGAALLRGMGWKDGEELGRNKGVAVKPREIKARPALLGIGAKAEAEVGLETVWEKGKPKRKAAQTYNPVALRNKKTGELVSEEELKTRLEKQKLAEEKESKEARMKTFELDEDEPRKERSRKDTERKKDDRRKDRDEDDYRRHKDRTRDDRRREDKYDDGYDDRRREKRRDKRERSYSPDSRSKDKRRERSRSPDDRRSKDKRRERSRSRDDRREKDKRRDRDRDRSGDRHRDSDDSRKRRREYDDERDERKRRYKDERSRR